jgi:glycosyltransferase involved in cell wall biosynthesis
MERSDEPFLLILRAGGTWDVVQGLSFIAQAFGRHYRGEVVTYTVARRQVNVGRIRISAFPLGPEWIPHAIRRLAYILRVVAHGLRLRWVRGHRLVVIAYDPFQSGAIGLLLRWLAGAVFICEVNGVYGHPDTLIDLEDRRKAAVKRARMLRVGSFVLRRAHLIKLLYPEQLIGFSVPASQPPRESFHDIVNPSLFAPSGCPAEKQFIFVGHPYLLKGVDLLLEAFSRFSVDFPDWVLMVVGWKIEESARDVAFPRDRVEFRGPQAPEQLRELMERSAALVLPSRSEAMGRVLLEAAFLARPRIGSRAGGIPRVINDGIDGLLFNSGDSADLERALRSVAGAAESERRAMGEAARQRALAEFTEDEYFRRYRAIIGRLAAEAGWT